MDQVFARTISYVFHPIFMVFYMLVYVMYALPEYFATPDVRQKTFIVLSFLALSVLFPLLGITLMRLQGLIRSLDMKSKKERIGPFILVSIFYLWLYVNIRQNTLVPDLITFFVLGSIITIFLGLFINNFSRISLHCAGAGGLATAVIFLYNQYLFPGFDILLPFSSMVLQVSNDFVLLCSILMAGLVGTARLMLGAHENEEIYGGYLVGISSQLIAIIIYF